MAIHEVQPGECLASIAKAAGFSNWKTLYKHESNAELRRKRPDPNLLEPGDEVAIPEATRKSEDASSEVVHRFKRPTQRVRLRIAILNDKWEPSAGRAYALTIDGHEYKGKLDSRGVLEHPKPDEPPIAVDTQEGILEVEGSGAPGDGAVRFKLMIGHLGPHDRTWGVRARLSNVGLFAGPVNAPPDDKLTAALNVFRRRMNLAPQEDRTVDQETSSRLEKFHDHTPAAKAATHA
jgi:N-acetylmuramoyl-L-alanine amidase